MHHGVSPVSVSALNDLPQPQLAGRVGLVKRKPLQFHAVLKVDGDPGEHGRAQGVHEDREPIHLDDDIVAAARLLLPGSSRSCIPERHHSD